LEAQLVAARPDLGLAAGLELDRHMFVHKVRRAQVERLSGHGLNDLGAHCE